MTIASRLNRLGNLPDEKPGLAAPDFAIGKQTSGLLGKRGWVLWRCRVLNGEIIKLVADETVPGPGDYPVYTLDELELLENLQPSTIRLINHIKKLERCEIFLEE